jgi:hypothetical protein
VQLRRIATLLGCLAPLVLPASALADSTPNTFKTVCKLEQLGQFDPIVHPGLEPMGHLHEFFGNTGITPTSTGYTLQQAGAGADGCQDKLDTAGYWAPELFANGQPVTPTMVDVYYERIPGLQVAPGDTCPALIEGCNGPTITSVVVPQTDFRLIAGNAEAVGLQKISVIKWACQDNSTTGTLPMNCGGSKYLTVHIVFPSCWDGGTDLQANNTENVQYPSDVGDVSTCPPGFDVQIPRLALTVHYDLYPTQPACSATVTANCINYAISARNPNDPSGPPLLGPPFTIHADWLNGWQTDTSLGAPNPDSFNELIARCDNGPDGTPACGVIIGG